VPSLLKVMVTGSLVTVPTVVVPSDERTGSEKLALHSFSAVLVQVTVLVAAVPRES